MSDSLVKQDDSPYSGFNPAQVALIKSQIFPGSTDDELQLFLMACKRTRLDPFTKQIYAMHRRRKRPGSNSDYQTYVCIQTSIDGFRVVAGRYKDFAGSGEPVYTYAEGDTEKKKPHSAKIEVFKINQITGERYVSGVGIAYWDEYYPEDPKNAVLWNKMPHNQLAKCAESLALRKAFPNDLANVYTEDEMGQSRDAVIAVDPVRNQLKEDALKKLSEALLDEDIPINLRDKVQRNWDFLSRGGPEIIDRTRIGLENARTSPKKIEIGGKENE